MSAYTAYTTEWKLEQVVPYLLKYYFGNHPTTNTELSQAFWTLMGKDLRIGERTLWNQVPYQIHLLKESRIVEEVLVKKEPIVSVYACILSPKGEEQIQAFVSKYSKTVIDAEIATYLKPHLPPTKTTAAAHISHNETEELSSLSLQQLLDNIDRKLTASPPQKILVAPKQQAGHHRNVTNEQENPCSPNVGVSDISPARLSAEQQLRKLFGIDAFYDEQWETIENILAGKRVLLIQKTGFGKSLCYQYPATQLSGVTIVFSPLIALMRDQVGYLKSIGIAAECLHSEQEQEVNAAILEQARRGQIKLLYIAPERQENPEWLDAAKRMPISMVVIDEAHCISVWGHDFRPAYRRIVKLVTILPQHFPVLAATATATETVAQDVARQIGGNVTVIRGNLLRPNFRLQVVHVHDEDAKMVWLAQFLQQQKGTGLVYTGTRVNTDLYASWLRFAGVDAINYNAGLDGEARQEIEQGLIGNRWKCIVATNALGMGIDKPDIRFLVHTQIPQSPIHYYQEIGRGGRDGKPTDIALLYDPKDRDLPEHFIRNSRPSLDKYRRVMEALKQEPLKETDLLRRTNLTQTQVRVIRTDLMDQGIIRQVMYGRTKVYEYQFGAPALNPAAHR